MALYFITRLSLTQLKKKKKASFLLSISTSNSKANMKIPKTLLYTCIESTFTFAVHTA